MTDPILLTAFLTGIIALLTAFCHSLKSSECLGAKIKMNGKNYSPVESPNPINEHVPLLK